jgi:HK97 family phage portal protein
MKFLQKIFPQKNIIQSPQVVVNDSREMEIKSFGGYGLPYTNMFSNYGWYDLVAQQSLIYYRNCSPVADAIDKISQAVAAIRPRVKDLKTDKYIEHPVLELLKRPFADQTYTEFMEEFVTYFLVTGNNYTMLTGNVNKPPVEMVNVHPTEVNITPSERDGYNYAYNVSRTPRNYVFVRDEKKYGFRYIEETQIREIWQTKTLNTRDQVGSGMYGCSKLLPIIYEIDQHLHSNKHNLSLLQKGAKLTLLLTAQTPLNPEQEQSIRAQLQAMYQGSGNAGNAMVASGGFDAKELGQNNRDMDFLNLKRELKFDIYNKLGIPLSLISTDHSTMNNLEQSMLRFYNDAVIPTASRIFAELTLLLMPRYGSENLEITFNPLEIPALEQYRITVIKTKKEIGIYTLNELRALDGLDPVDGGDYVYSPANQIPIGGDINTEPNDDEKQLANELNAGRTTINLKDYQKVL